MKGGYLDDTPGRNPLGCRNTAVRMRNHRPGRANILGNFRFHSHTTPSPRVLVAPRGAGPTMLNIIHPPHRAFHPLGRRRSTAESYGRRRVQAPPVPLVLVGAFSPMAYRRYIVVGRKHDRENSGRARRCMSDGSRLLSRCRRAPSGSRPKNPLVQLPQPSELLDPLLQGQTIDCPDAHGTVEPIGRLARTEVEIAVTLLQQCGVPAPGEFVINGFQREA